MRFALRKGLRVQINGRMTEKRELLPAEVSSRASQQRRSVLSNATMAVAQVVISGCVLFLLYRYLLAAVGIESLGIWSLVFAATAVGGIGELGFSRAVVKFVAKYRARNES